MIAALDDLDGAALHSSVVIVGAGPAGITLASELAGAGVDVTLLESGREAPDSATADLDEIESIGMRRAPQAETRARGLGGTSSLWSGRCAVLDEIDFEQRPWVPHSGWPISPATLEPYLGRAATLLGLGSARFRSARSPLPDELRAKPWDGAKLEPLVFQASLDHSGTSEPTRDASPDVVEGAENLGALHHPGAPEPVRFGPSYVPRLAERPNVSIVTDATVVRIDTDGADHGVHTVVVRSASGREVTFSGTIVVIAAGGLESARLLLASASTDRGAPGNRYDVVGRFLMDHPFAPVATLTAAGEAALRRRFGQQWLDRDGRRYVSSTGVRLSPALQRAEQLLNAQIHTVDRGDLRSPLRRAKDSVDGLRRDGISRESLAALSRTVRDGPRLVGGACDRYLRHRPSLTVCEEVVFGCVVEQVPDPDSRITLSPDRRDRNGIPLARLDWRASDAEFATLERMLVLFHAELERLGHQPPTPATWLADGAAGWRATVHDMAHPLGTTRMSASPRDGVVDVDCRVHDTGGLYVVGSSVFPTSGTINPTLTIVALALRLANHLRARLQAAPAVSTSPTQGGSAVARLHAASIEKAPTPRARLKVGVVGLGARAVDVHLPVLNALSDRFEIVGFTSRDAARRAERAERFGLDGFESPDDLVSATSPDILLLAGAIDAVEEVAWSGLATGLPLLAETPLAWGVRSARKLAQAAADRTAPFAIAEQMPFLPVEQLKRALLAGGHLGTLELIDNDFAIYDYHGIAAMRSYLPVGAWPQAVSATAGTVRGARVLFGSVRCNDGTILRQQYISTEATSTGSASLRVIGRHAQLLEDRIVWADGSAAEVERIEAAGSLTALTIAHRDGQLRWDNPFAGHPFSDEQIAVATLWTSLASAIGTPAAEPLYTAADALVDVEVLAAMRLSARRHGRPVSIPFPPHEMALLGASRVTDTLRSRLAGLVARRTSA